MTGDRSQRARGLVGQGRGPVAVDHCADDVGAPDISRARLREHDLPLRSSPARVARHAAQHRAHEQLEGDVGAGGVARQREHGDRRGVGARQLEQGGRSPGPQAHATKHQRGPEADQGRQHEVVITDRDPAAGDEHVDVTGGRARERGAQVRGLVARDAEVEDLGASGPRLPGQHQPVGADDLSALRPRADGDQLVAGTQDRDARRSVHLHHRVPAAGQQGQLTGPERRAGQ